MNEQTSEQMNEQPTEVQHAASERPEVMPDPLTTSAYEPSEEERSFRKDTDLHRRLNRRPKPLITQERADELVARSKEAEVLYDELTEAQRTEDKERIAELEDKLSRRRLTYSDALALFLYESNGLLGESDLRSLRAAAKRRARREERTRRLSTPSLPT